MAQRKQEEAAEPSLLAKLCPCIKGSFLRINPSHQHTLGCEGASEISQTFTHNNLPVIRQPYQQNFAGSQISIYCNETTENDSQIGTNSAPIPAIRTETMEEDQDDYEEIEREYELYMKKKKTAKVATIYPVCRLPENKLVVVGSHNGRLMCKVKNVFLRHSETALARQRESNAKIAPEKEDARSSRKRKKNQQQKPQQKGSKVDEELDRYWTKRYYLFERFDEGILLDRESWYSVTPEAVSEYVASCFTGVETVLDGFCGAGGDAIKLATVCNLVYCNDIDQKKLQCLTNNAAIYSVDNILHMQGNFLGFTLEKQSQKIDAVYLAPPWGGPNYHMLPSMPPKQFTPPLDVVLNKAVSLSENIFLLLPVNIDIQLLCASICNSYRESNVVASTCCVSVDKIYIDNKLKFVAVYIGPKLQKEVKIHEQLNYVYLLLNEQNQQANSHRFIYKRVIRRIREEYGMVNLLNYIFECQKFLYPKGDFMSTFENFLINRSLIEAGKLAKLKDLDKKDEQRKHHEQKTKLQVKQSKMQRKDSARLQAERDEKMEAVRDVDVNGASNTYNETISAVSAISDSLLKNLTQIKSTNSRGEAKSQARESQEDVQVVRLTSQSVDVAQFQQVRPLPSNQI